MLPELGESVTEGTVTRWLKKVGDSVEVDEALLEISTDKVDTEIPSPFAGVLQEILVQEDETVAVGSPLARIGDSAAAPAAEAPAPAAEAPLRSRAPRQSARTAPLRLPQRRRSSGSQRRPRARRPRLRRRLKLPPQSQPRRSAPSPPPPRPMTPMSPRT